MLPLHQLAMPAGDHRPLLPASEHVTPFSEHVHRRVPSRAAQPRVHCSGSSMMWARGPLRRRAAQFMVCLVRALASERGLSGFLLMSPYLARGTCACTELEPHLGQAGKSSARAPCWHVGIFETDSTWAIIQNFTNAMNQLSGDLSLGCTPDAGAVPPIIDACTGTRVGNRPGTG